MRLKTMLAVALLGLACTSEPAQPPVVETTATTTTTTTTTTATQPVPAQPPPERAQPLEKNITIDAVEVANPVVVTGLARTFENSVSLRLRDARGRRIVESFTTATGEMGQHSPYRGTLWVTRDPGGSVTVEALEYSAKDGSEQSLVSVKRPFTIATIDARLHFPDRQCTRVRPYIRRIPKSISAARLLVEALLAGPTAQERAAGAEMPFPKGSGVRSVNLKDGTVTVDFNERLRNVGGSCAATMIRQSVTETLQSLPAVKKVVITAGGSESQALQP
jgi:Immunoglobulin-like domain of bacterial spore germination/Sporulation and spore germination